MNKYIEIKQEVLDTINNKKGVVALESTIITHGMPYPENIKMAKKVEEIIRKNGAVPATIAIIDGIIKIGLTEEELLYLANKTDVIKVSKRDFGYVIANKLTGATTVSGTMLASKMANINVFATGGIGGVHRGAETTFDISRDLEELSEIDVLVVCAGAKAILDLELTTEYLETKGVEILGYKTKELPAFFTRESGISLNYEISSADEAAKIMKSKWELGIKGGILVANPIPEEHSIDSAKINKAINDALREAKEHHILGKDVTPYLLKKVNERTEGKSLEANLELVYNNAEVAAKIAVSYSKL